MHEIDPQSENSLAEAPLTEALRRLARTSQQGAPAEMGAGLAVAFRRHHARRRLAHRMSVAALAACILLVAGLLSMRGPHQVPGKEQVHETGSTPAHPANPVTVHDIATTRVQPAVKRARPKAAAIAASARRQFLALPGYDPAVPADELHVVRVQLPASALWQMGAPVVPDSGTRKFMADFIVSQDGTPYAVRLVQ